MKFSPNVSESDDPEYWWRESDACRRVVQMLLRENDLAARQTVCDKCHGMLERAAKAVLCEQGKLGDERSHNIRSLFIKAGLLEALPPRQQGFISDIANLHAEAAYPDEVEERCIWYADARYQEIVLNAVMVYSQLLSRKGTYGEEGADDSIGGR